MGVTILSEHVEEAGYVVREELFSGDMAGGGPDFKMVLAYNMDGEFIGTPAEAEHLCDHRGIKPEKSKPEHSVCSIGFSEREQSWYGWSHRALGGFKVGDTVEADDVLAGELSPGFVSFPVGFVAQTLGDCRNMAVTFAAAVS